MGPADLEQVLLPLKKYSNPNLIVGLEISDDAAVYKLSADTAVVQTVDFFPPVVDDPYMYGAIAAANSMSDVYAMGGDVIMGINIVAFPDTLPKEVLSLILQGGADKMAEVGAVVVGGHTVVDKEPKYGICVTGTVHPDRVFTKGGALPGDQIYLTKPLGAGLITTAHKRDIVAQADLDVAVASMARLNAKGAQILREIGAEHIHACTDITGFGILGHGVEMANHSQNVDLLLHSAVLPLLPGALHYSELGCVPGGTGRNRIFLQDGTAPKVRFLRDVGLTLENVLFDPQTSGGLFFAVPQAVAAQVEAAFAAAHEPLWLIGEAVPGSGTIMVD
jgi:selenide, water dikinase